MSSKIRILYIDDYELDRELVKDALEREHGGFELMEAANKQEFEALLQRHEFDLVLSDFNIAGFEGLQVLEAVQAHDPKIPVIIVTGTGSEEIAAQALKQGAADYVIKRPKHIQRLPQTILSVIEKQTFRHHRQQAEIALKESEEKFRNISENSLVGIYIIQDNIFEYVNPKFAEIFGYSVEECLDNMHFRQLVYPEDFGTVQEQVRKRAIGESQSVQYAFRGIKKGGEIIHVEIFGSSVLLHGKRAVTGTMLDVTQRKRAEEALINERDFIERIMRTSPAGIVRVNADGVVVYANRRAEKLLGIELQGIKRRTYNDPVWKITDFDGGPFPEEKLPFNIVKQTGTTVFNVQHAIQWPDGKRILLSINATPLINSHGQFDGMVATIEDITERQQIEEALRQAQKMESIGNLAGGIAHDFNNILSSIIGFTELALDDVEKDSMIEDNLQEVYTAGKRAKELVTQILAFARQSEKELKPIRVDAIIKEAVQFIRSSIPTTIKIKKEITSDSLIIGNQTHVHQIMMNLCTNAAHAMEGEGGVLGVSLKDIEVDWKAGKNLNLNHGNYIELSVSDTGVGIPPDIIDSIFEPYFTTKKPGEGTGMGLAMVHGIVESYGGKIFVDSKIGKPTTFTIYLPATRKRKIQRQNEPEQLPSGTERILFVDDEEPIAKMGSQGLERLGYQVTTRTSSVEALELFRAKPNEFELVITDMTMPNMTGDTLALELMSIRPDIPVILCTGYSKKISDKTASEIGIKAFAYKPIIKADLAQTVRKVLDEAKLAHKAP